MADNGTVCGFVYRNAEQVMALIAFPDGSHLYGVGDSSHWSGDQSPPPHEWPMQWFPHSAAGSHAVVEQANRIVQQTQEPWAWVIQPCIVPLTRPLTVDDTSELLQDFHDQVQAGSTQEEFRSVRGFTRTYATSFHTGGGAGVGGRQKVEDRAPLLELEEGEELVRPNGERYVPRTLIGHTDAAVLRRGREHGMYALLRGAPGSGKTALADATFPDLIPFTCTGDTTVAHLVGSWLPNPDGTFRWKDGPLTEAMLRGVPILLDEIDELPHEVNTVLHSAMDGRRMLRLDDRPDRDLVQAAEGFYVVGTYNPGKKPLREAILSRFAIQVEVDTDFDTAAELGVPERFVGFARNLYTRSARAVADGGEPIWYPQMRELLAAMRSINAGFGEAFAVAAIIDACPVPEDVQTLREVARSVWGETPQSMRLGDRA